MAEIPHVHQRLLRRFMAAPGAVGQIQVDEVGIVLVFRAAAYRPAEVDRRVVEDAGGDGSPVMGISSAWTIFTFSARVCSSVASERL